LIVARADFLFEGANMSVDVGANVQTVALGEAEDVRTAGEVAAVGAGADCYGDADEHCGDAPGEADSVVALVQIVTEYVAVLF
jgi:hypothetical protein